MSRCSLVESLAGLLGAVRVSSWASPQTPGVALCDGREVVGDRLVQPVAGGGDPRVDVGQGARHEVDIPRRRGGRRWRVRGPRWRCSRLRCVW
jgi:hypothetical protein